MPFTYCNLQVLTGELLSSVFCFVYVFLLKWEKFLATEFEVVYVITPFPFDKNQKDLEPILNTMQLHGQWIDGSFFGKNDDYHAKSFLLNYGAHAGHGSYEWIIMLEKFGHLDLTVFHLIWVIGSYGNWKNQNLGGRFGFTS